LNSLGDAVRRELGVAISQGRSRVVTAGARVARALETPAKAVGLLVLLDALVGPLMERVMYSVAPKEDVMAKKAASLEEMIDAIVGFEYKLSGWSPIHYLLKGTQMQIRGSQAGVTAEEMQEI